MKKVGISMVKNEADIIEPFVRHTLAYLDELIVVDNASSDETRFILEVLAAEYSGRLFVKHDGRTGFPQAEMMSALMKQAAAEYGADWIFPLDADEFLRPEGDELRLPEIQKTEDPYYLFVQWQTYCATPTDSSGQENPALRILHRLPDQDEPFSGKAIVPAIFASHPEISLACGNHSLNFGKNEVRKVDFPCLKLAHFSLRSAGQIAQKAFLCSFQHFSRTREFTPFHVGDILKMRENFEDYEREFYGRIPAYFKQQKPYLLSMLVPDPLSYKGEPLTQTKKVEGVQVLIRCLFNYLEELSIKVAELSPRESSSVSTVLLTIVVENGAETEKIAVNNMRLSNSLSNEVQIKFNGKWCGCALRLRVDAPHSVVDIPKMTFLPIEKETPLTLMGQEIKKYLCAERGALVLSLDHYFRFVTAEIPAGLRLRLPEVVRQKGGDWLLRLVVSVDASEGRAGQAVSSYLALPELIREQKELRLLRELKIPVLVASIIRKTFNMVKRLWQLPKKR